LSEGTGFWARSKLRFADLFIGKFVHSLTAGALYFVGFKIGGDFQFETAGASEEDKLIYASHDVPNLPHLFFHRLLFFRFCGRLTYSNILFFKGGRGYYCF
jgi:hypothetical protein